MTDWWVLLLLPPLAVVGLWGLREIFAYDRVLQERLGEREPRFTIADIFTSQDDPVAERARRRVLILLVVFWSGIAVVTVASPRGKSVRQRRREALHAGRYSQRDTLRWSA